MGKFWRSLNLKLVLIVYLLLLQIVVYLDRYAQILTLFPLTVTEHWPAPYGGENITKLTFYPPEREFSLIIDVMRPLLLIAMILYPQSGAFALMMIAAMVVFQNDYAPVGVNGPKRNEAYAGLLYNLNYNTLFRLSLLNELIIRITALFLWIKRIYDRRVNRSQSVSFQFSLADLLVLTILLGALAFTARSSTVFAP